MAQRFSQLSAHRQALLRRCQQIGYGEIRRFLVCDGEPVLTPDSEVLFDVKLGGGDGVRPEQSLSDFELRREVVDLFAQMDSIQEGVLESLEIHAGMPRRIRFKLPVQN
jgi:hypothetical protein